MSGLVFDLNEAARVCPNLLTQRQLKDAGLAVHFAVAAFVAAPDSAHLAALQCAWSRALRILARADLPPAGGPGGGALPQPERRAA